MMNIKNETTGLFIEMLSEDNEPVYTSDQAVALLVTEEDLVEILEKLNEGSSESFVGHRPPKPR
jgi:hypothetical protein